MIAAAGGGCLPDPEADFQDFKDRTAHLDDQAPATTDASFDSKPPETAVTALYAGICVTSLAAGDPNQALRFYTETSYSPDAPGSPTGKLTMTVTPMVGYDLKTNRAIAPKTVSKSETRGAAIVAADVPVTGGGRFTAILGTVNLDAEANSVSGRAAVIEGATLDGLYGAGDRFCSTLGGQLTKPYGFKFDPAQNTCLFQRVKDGDPLPTIPAAEFACAL